MGIYINPPKTTKEEFLHSNGVMSLNPRRDIPEDCIQVCLVDNGGFTAAAVIYDQAELDDFDRFDDSRPKVWFVVERQRLKGVISKTDESFLGIH